MMMMVLERDCCNIGGLIMIKVIVKMIIIITVNSDRNSWDSDIYGECHSSCNGSNCEDYNIADDDNYIYRCM